MIYDERRFRQMRRPRRDEIIMVRPHRSMSIGDLTKIVDDKKVTQKTISEVIDELSHRTTPKAKKLLARLKRQNPSLDSRASKPDPTPRPSRGKQSRKSKPVDESGDGVVPRETESLGPEAKDAAQRLAALRETYTEESEILAKWGITTALPADMRAELLSRWKTKLTDQPDQLGRSLATLEVDVSRLRRLNEFTMIENIA
jgi:hypothetical protein